MAYGSLTNPEADHVGTLPRSPSDMVPIATDRVTQCQMPGTKERVQAVIARTFNLSPDQATDDLRMGNPPSWDSVGHMGLILELEDEFGITFPTYEVANLQSVDEIVRAIATRQAS